jgi:hypothetical protein
MYLRYVSPFPPLLQEGDTYKEYMSPSCLG